MDKILIYYTLYPYKHWNFIVLASHKGLKSIYLYHNEDLSGYLYDEKIASFYKDLLDKYFSNQKLPSFDLDIKGTLFELKVYNALTKIPYGVVSTYKTISELIGLPKAARAVGNAVGKNPIMLLIPCHRIIKSDGTIGGFSSDPKLKIDLLYEEKKLRS